MELLTAQDEPQEEDAGDQDPAEGEEEPATVEGESEEEHDVWRTYYEIYDNYFDYDL